MVDPNAPIDQSSVVMITLKDVWMEMVKMRDDVSRISASTAQLIDHEARMRSLERWRYALPASVIMALGSVSVTVVGLVAHK